MTTTQTTGAVGDFNMAAMFRALEAIKPPAPMTIVQHQYMEPGKAWQMMDGGRLYAFIHPDDLAAIPTVPAAGLGMAGVPVRAFDAEMRAVFVRGLERLAAAERRAHPDAFKDWPEPE